MLYARVADELYLHGSPLSRLLKRAVSGTELCFTVTLLDGLVLARSAFHHSLNYRSVVSRPGPGGAGSALRSWPRWRRWSSSGAGPLGGCPRTGRAGAEGDRGGGTALDEASAKIRTGPPVDAAEDYDLPVWAGEIPLRLTAGAPMPDERCSAPLPGYLQRHARGHA